MPYQCHTVQHTQWQPGRHMEPLHLPTWTVAAVLAWLVLAAFTAPRKSSSRVHKQQELVPSAESSSSCVMHGAVGRLYRSFPKVPPPSEATTVLLGAAGLHARAY
jgi:hypothetical protein